MKKSQLKRPEESVKKEDEKFSMDDADTKEFLKAIDKYLPDHLKRFKNMTDAEIDAAVASPDFEEKEKERYNKFCKPFFDMIEEDKAQIYADESEKLRIMEAELHTSEITDRDRLTFEINRFFPEFKKHYKEGTIGSDREFCHKLKRLIDFGESIGEDPMSDLILRMNLK